MTEIRRTSFDELSRQDGFEALAAAYAEECAVPALPRSRADAEGYRALEAQGVYQLFGAWQDGRLIGFLGVILNSVPHHEGVKFASVESLFVEPGSRKGGPGLALVREAERFAAGRGAAALFMSAPRGGRLERLLPRLGFDAANTVFVKALGQGGGQGSGKEDKDVGQDVGQDGAGLPGLPVLEEAAGLPASGGALPSQSAGTVARIAEAGELARSFPQETLRLEHEFWAGLYARTLFVPKGVMITGVCIRIPTLLIVSGDVLALGDAGFERFTGYRVLRGQAGRRALFVAVEDTAMTMLFATRARTLDEAEREFTDTPEELRR